MKLLATGDNHLGKSQDLGRAPGHRLAEQEVVWRNTLVMARDHRCAAVLHAGDLFDGRRPEPNVMLAAERPLVEHRAAGGCPVYVVSGNHDIPHQDGPSGLDVLAEAGLIELAREPVVWSLPGDVDVCALPWTPLARLVAQDGGEAGRDEIAALAADLLIETARGMRNPGRTQILLGHWSVSQTVLPNGLDVGSLGGVVLPMDDLDGIGFDEVVFGHIHRSECYGHFTYVGSPQPLDFGEAACPHGCWMMEWQPAMRGFAMEFVPLESRPFVTIDWDFADGDDFSQLLEGYGVWDPESAADSPVSGAYVKARYSADEEMARRIDHDAVRRALELSGAHRVWIEPTIERAHRDRGHVFADGQTRAEQLAAFLDASGVNGDVKPAMLARAERYLEGSSS